MLKQRILSAFVLIPIVFWLAWQGGWWIFGAVSLAAGAAAWELFRMAGLNDFVRPIMALGVPAAVLLVLEAGLPQNALRLQALLVLVLLIGLTLMLFLNRPHASMDLLITLGGALYLGLTLRFLGLLRSRPDGLVWLLFTAVTVWSVDTGAYFVGVNLGRHKLWPRISPKKSWEGFGGGLLTGAVVAAIIARFWLPGVEAWQGALLGLVIAIVGPLGDLSESLFKRGAGVKDSSHLIPGHGGVLDRLDSFIFVAPVVYFISLIFWG